MILLTQASLPKSLTQACINCVGKGAARGFDREYCGTYRCRAQSLVDGMRPVPLRVAFFFRPLGCKWHWPVMPFEVCITCARVVSCDASNVQGSHLRCFAPATRTLRCASALCAVVQQAHHHGVQRAHYHDLLRTLSRCAACALSRNAQAGCDVVQLHTVAVSCGHSTPL